MTQNRAAWITGSATQPAHPFSIQDAPYPTPGHGEVVIKNAAVAIVRSSHQLHLYQLIFLFSQNPVDWKIQYD